VQIKPVKFSLFLCSSAGCSSPDAAASRSCRKRPRLQPRHHGHTCDERRRERRPGHHDQVPVTINCRGQPTGHHGQIPAWRRGHRPRHHD
jgi:hypothetical protein